MIMLLAAFKEEGGDVGSSRAPGSGWNLSQNRHVREMAMGILKETEALAVPSASKG
jgi:hypothetical protein